MNTIQKISHHNATRYNGDIEDWAEERSMSREEKIAFVDANCKLVSDWYCPLSVLLEVMNRYQEDVKSGKINEESAGSEYFGGGSFLSGVVFK